jgi:hypothetical protein
MSLLISVLAMRPLAVRQEDGSLPGEPLPLLEGLIWFLFIPVAISALVWILVSVYDKSEKKEVAPKEPKRDILTSIE